MIQAEHSKLEFMATGVHMLCIAPEPFPMGKSPIGWNLPLAASWPDGLSLASTGSNVVDLDLSVNAATILAELDQEIATLYLRNPVLPRTLVPTQSRGAESRQSL